MIAIRAYELTKKFPSAERPSVKSLSFEIQRGETVAFLGPNGAGKSTTLKMMCGILSPTSGVAEILGEKAGSIKANRRLGLVFGTRSQLYQHMTVMDCLGISGEIYGLSGERKRTRIQALSKTFQLDPFLKRRVRTLSLGERMRCEIAAALLHEPEVLLADEPTIGLDVVAKNSLREMIRLWQKKEQTTFMLTSHDLSDVEALCDRCILIDQGEKRFDGKLEDLRGEAKDVRRVEVTVKDSSHRKIEGNNRFLKVSDLTAFTHLYEWNTRTFPMSDALYLLSQYYGDSLVDLKIGTITLEEVLSARYGGG
jgi:ABC-2 type transport system ATP-binding protein